METLFFGWLEIFLLDGCRCSTWIGAPRDPNPPPPDPNPPEPITPIGIGASLPPLSPKQGGKDPSIV